MNKKMVSSLIRDLNSISRMAILENAMVTEQLLCSYTRIIKYQLSQEREVVMMKSELNCIREMCRFYELKMNHTLSCIMTVDEELQQIVVPHFSYAQIIYNLLEQISISEAEALSLNIAFQVQETSMVCSIRLNSSQPIHNFVHEQAGREIDHEARLIGVGIERLKQYFGERMLYACSNVGSQMEVTIEIKDEMGEPSGTKK